MTHRQKTPALNWIPVICLWTCVQAHAQPETGPVIDEFGPVFAVADADYSATADEIYRAVFDVSTSPNDASRLNPRIETLARFLNMHGQAGVPTENMKLALVLHGRAGKDVLDQDSYRSRFDTDNPNRVLVAALIAEGVEIYLCGQTAAYLGYSKQELLPDVTLALSAMTALVRLQSQGYQLIAF